VAAARVTMATPLAMRQWPPHWPPQRGSHRERIAGPMPRP
jgi:hypothetical protein